MPIRHNKQDKKSVSFNHHPHFRSIHIGLLDRLEEEVGVGVVGSVAAVDGFDPADVNVGYVGAVLEQAGFLGRAPPHPKLGRQSPKLAPEGRINTQVNYWGTLEGADKMYDPDRTQDSALVVEYALDGENNVVGRIFEQVMDGQGGNTVCIDNMLKVCDKGGWDSAAVELCECLGQYDGFGGELTGNQLKKAAAPITGKEKDAGEQECARIGIHDSVRAPPAHRLEPVAHNV